MIITPGFFLSYVCCLYLVHLFHLEIYVSKSILKIHCKLNRNTFDPVLEKAILFAVGNTLVCDELSEAKVLSWTGERFKGNYH